MKTFIRLRVELLPGGGEAGGAAEEREGLGSGATLSMCGRRRLQELTLKMQSEYECKRFSKMCAASIENGERYFACDQIGWG